MKKKLFIISKNKCPKKGFTLIELIAVMAIIAILTAALLPTVSGYIAESKKVEVINQCRKVVTAYETLKVRYTISEDMDIASLSTRSPNLLSSDDIDKLPIGFTISKCIDIVNTDKYDFTIEDDNSITVSTITP